MFAVQNFCERHQDRGTLVGTDEVCSWDQPRKKSESSKTSEFNYGTQKSLKELNYTPSKTKPQMSQRELEKSILQICKGTDALILHCIEPLSEESDDSDCNIEHVEAQLFTDMILNIKGNRVLDDPDEIIKILKSN